MTKQNYMELYETIQDYAGLYRTIHDNTGPWVDILPIAPINIVETNKHFGKRLKGIRRIHHL